MVAEVLAIRIDVVDGVEDATLLLDQEAVCLKGRKETLDVRFGGWVVVVVVVDDVLEGRNDSISAPDGEDHFMHSLGVERGEFCDKE